MILGYIFTYAYIMLVLFAAVVAEKFHLLGQEGRRKLVHISLVFTWLIMIRYFVGTIHLIIIPATFVILNLFSYLNAKKETGSSIPILSSMERTGTEETPGTVYYALSIMVAGGLTLLNENWMIPCGLGLFCMAFGDGMAGVVGKNTSGVWAKHITKEKSIGGSIACFVFSVAGCALLLVCLGQEVSLIKVVILGLVCTVLELPGQGMDNITVPLGCMGIAGVLF